MSNCAATGVGHVAFAFGSLAEEVEPAFALAVVLEAGNGSIKSLEALENLVGYGEGVGRCYRWVRGAVAVGEVEVPHVGHYVVEQAVAFGQVDCGVGRYAAAVAHYASCTRAELVGEAVGRARRREPSGLRWE